jgi:hypothetical protein
MTRKMTPAEALDTLGAVWSPDFAAYAAGELDATAVRCVLCQHAPCDCPPFGSAAYFAALDRLHGREPRPADAPLCSAPECPVTERCGTHTPGIAVSGTGYPTVACIADPEGGAK